jgi:hypothetical protein
MAKKPKKEPDDSRRERIRKLETVAYHDSLPEELLVRIRKVWDIVKDGCYEPSLERFEAGFLFDMHPEKEVAIWEWIADKYGKVRSMVVHAGCEATPDDLKKLQAIVVAASSGVPEMQKKLVDIATELYERKPPPERLSDLLR